MNVKVLYQPDIAYSVNKVGYICVTYTPFQSLSFTQERESCTGVEGRLG